MTSASSSLCFSTLQISDQMPFEYSPSPFIQSANDKCKEVKKFQRKVRHKWHCCFIKVQEDEQD